jgi:hypothetical protein
MKEQSMAYRLHLYVLSGCIDFLNATVEFFCSLLVWSFRPSSPARLPHLQAGVCLLVCHEVTWKLKWYGSYGWKLLDLSRSCSSMSKLEIIVWTFGHHTMLLGTAANARVAQLPNVYSGLLSSEDGSTHQQPFFWHALLG